MSNPQQLVQKLWNYCNILRDDGLSYGDYVEQLTFLSRLKSKGKSGDLRFGKGNASSPFFPVDGPMGLSGIAWAVLKGRLELHVADPTSARRITIPAVKFTERR